MNPINEYVHRVYLLWPAATVKVREPRDKINGEYWIDIGLSPRAVTVQWQSSRGWGISDTSDDRPIPYTSAPDLRVTSVDQLIEETRKILK